MDKLLIGFAGLLIGVAVPATAQSLPPPGVAQGTSPLAMPARHVPPIILSPAPMRRQARVITRDDVLRHVRAMFAKLDSNDDGFISKDEIASHHARVMAGMHPAMTAAHEENGGFSRHPLPMANPSEMFDRIDANHDGVISRKEFILAHTRMREREQVTGADHMLGHGLSMREPPIHMRMREGYPPSGFMARLFDMADSNHDGRVSLQEAETAAVAHFDRMDANHDGQVTPDERRRARQLMHERRPG
jgi:Ca2+-binding EF-hand superfamily protein